MSAPGAGRSQAALAASAAEQRVDVLDDEGRVIGQVTRAEMRERNLLHRSVFIVVVTSLDELVVHKRADWKDVWPSRWDISFGGVVDAGESVVDAACRELFEEAGVQVAPAALSLLAEGRYEDDRIRELGTVYLTMHDGPFRFDDGEVVADDRIAFDDVGRWSDARNLCDDSSVLVLPVVLAHIERARGGGSS
jgi:isopentenyldiphosphate isomerase